ncbi:hypothetical protein DVQ95_21985 [Yersinia enterocolitica]|nr:hypothetical protein [Yersinia enterocolitica]EKN5913248.1 hypothetical protein [Yersinia enterocolitica]
MLDNSPYKSVSSLLNEYDWLTVEQNFDYQWPLQERDEMPEIFSGGCRIGQAGGTSTCEQP